MTLIGHLGGFPCSIGQHGRYSPDWGAILPTKQLIAALVSDK